MTPQARTAPPIIEQAEFMPISMPEPMKAVVHSKYLRSGVSQTLPLALLWASIFTHHPHDSIFIAELE